MSETGAGEAKQLSFAKMIVPLHTISIRRIAPPLADQAAIKARKAEAQIVGVEE